MGRTNINTVNCGSSISHDSSCDSSHQHLTIAAFGSLCITAVSTSEATTTSTNTTETNRSSTKSSDRKSKKHGKRHRHRHRDHEYSTATFEGRELVVVTNVEPVGEAFPKPDVVVLAEVILEDDPSHSSSSQHNKTRALHEQRQHRHRHQHQHQHQQRYSKNRNSSSLLTSDQFYLNRIIVKVVFLLASMFAIALYLENTGSNGLISFPLILTEKNRPHRSTNTNINTNINTNTSTITSTITKRHHTSVKNNGIDMTTDTGGDGNQNTTKEIRKVDNSEVLKPSDDEHHLSPQSNEHFTFPDRSGSWFRFHNLGDGIDTHRKINLRATREYKNLVNLVDSKYKFVLGVTGDTPLVSNDGKFLLCHNPIASVIARSRINAGEKKHTPAGTPIFPEDATASHTIREAVARAKKRNAAHDRARREALARGFTGNYDLEGFCVSVTLEELQAKHQFQSSDGEFEYVKRTGSPYERQLYYDSTN